MQRLGCRVSCHNRLVKTRKRYACEGVLGLRKQNPENHIKASMVDIMFALLALFQHSAMQGIPV